MHDSTLALLTLVFFGSEMTLALFRRARHTDGATRGDRGAIRVLWIVITLAITTAFSVSGYRPARLTFPPSWIRATALVDTGPFRFVRHPSYTGLLLAFCGFGLSLGNALSLIVLVAPIVAALWYRMQVEEAVLRQALGAAYDAYRARTKRLIPGVV